jgi:flagellar hook-basal body complex protein FliE
MSSISGSVKQFDPDLGLVQADRLSASNPAVAGKGEAPMPGGGFLDALSKTMEEVNEEQLKADHGIKELVAGKSKNIHETMLQIQKAELSLKAMMQVRNKVLEAYKEIMRMQV